MEISIPRGTKDCYGKEMMLRQKIRDVLRRNYEKYGFEPLETPAFESFELFTVKGSAGEAIKEEIYYFKDKSNRELGLRFDFTVPLARFIAMNSSIPKPFKRYQIGKVWRYDRPGKGRYREFEQADFDIVGVGNLKAEAECLSLISDCLKDLGIDDAIIKINSRKLMEGIALQIGIPEDKIMNVFRTIDKLDKIGFEGVRKELIHGREVDENIVEKLMGFLKLRGKDDLIEKLDKIVENETGRKGLEELKELMNLVNLYKLKNVEIDLTLMRGLEYYTGTVIEVKVKGENFSIGGGGRYDNLIGLYGKENMSAVGFSFGIDRIIDLLIEKFNMIREGVYICILGNVFEKGVEILRKIRDMGIKADMNYLNRNLGNQLNYADVKGYKYAIILGERDLREKKITIKNLENGEEMKIGFDDLERYLS